MLSTLSISSPANLNLFFRFGLCENLQSDGGTTSCLRFASLWVVIRVSSAFIFQTFAEVCYSVFVNRSSFKSVLNLRIKRTYLRVCCWSTIDLCLVNLPKRSSIKSVLKILLWIKLTYFSLENACYSWCVHQTGLFSSASVVPQSKFTGEL